VSVVCVPSTSPILRFLLAIAVLAWPTSATAQTVAAPQRARTGEELFRAGCAACHGNGGQGAVRSQLGFDEPLPNFAACRVASPEPDSDWLAIIHGGGPARAFSRRMPAFQDLLSDAEIERGVDADNPTRITERQ